MIFAAFRLALSAPVVAALFPVVVLSAVSDVVFGVDLAAVALLLAVGFATFFAAGFLGAGVGSLGVVIAKTPLD